MSTLSVRNPRDFAVGLLYAVIGAAFAIAAAGHEMGDPARIGPGFFPFWLGLVLAAIGAFTMLRSIWPRAARSRLDGWDVRSLGWMVGSVLLFAALLEPLGLALSVALLVVCASLASHEFTWRATLLNTLLLVGITVGGFVYGLSLPLPVWPAFPAR